MIYRKLQTTLPEQLGRSEHELRVGRIAGDLIAVHGANAVRVALERLNDAIDRGDRPDRNFWAEVVHAIIEQRRGT